MGKNRYRNKKALPAPIRTPVNKCIDETLNNGVDKTDMEENEVDYFSEDDYEDEKISGTLDLETEREKRKKQNGMIFIAVLSAVMFAIGLVMAYKYYRNNVYTFGIAFTICESITILFGTLILLMKMIIIQPARNPVYRYMKITVAVYLACFAICFGIIRTHV